MNTSVTAPAVTGPRTHHHGKDEQRRARQDEPDAGGRELELELELEQDVPGGDRLRHGVLAEQRAVDGARRQQEA
jgi:hypothetical protein